MKVYGMWFGGIGYNPPTGEDMEVFDSIEQAKSEFRSRAEDGGWMQQNFNYLHRESEYVRTPAVDRDTTSLWLFFGEPVEGEGYDLYPDRVVEFGPRGGIKVYPA